MLQKLFAAELFFCVTFLGKPFNNLHFGSNRSMVGSRQPERLVAGHALIPDEYVLKRFIERVTHMQLSCDVGRRDDYAVRGLVRVHLRVEITAALPVLVQPRFYGAVIVTFRHFLCHVLYLLNLYKKTLILQRTRGSCPWYHLCWISLNRTSHSNAVTLRCAADYISPAMAQKRLSAHRIRMILSADEIISLAVDKAYSSLSMPLHDKV